MNRSSDWEKRSRAAIFSILPRVELRPNKLLKADSTAVSPVGGDSPTRAANRKARVRRRRMGLDITWVTDRIGVGGGIWTAENMAAVSRTGITHIIDMQIEFDDTPLARPHGISVCWNPIDDDFEPKPPEVFARGVEFGLAALEANETKLFVHCAAGVHRAPMMTLALLSVMGWTMEDALELIEARRPAADFADVYVRSVENFLQGRR
jgi:Dual specificity phosphatase, catalytic domain